MENFKTINTRIKMKHDTASNWKTNNTVLLSGELGIDTTNRILKCGNGVSSWEDLPILARNISNVSQLTNDSNYATVDYVEEQLKNTSNSIKQIIPNELNSRFAISTSNTDLTSNMTVSSMNTPNTGRLRGIVYGNGKWIAVNASGYVQYSTNSVNWLVADQFTTNALTSVTYGNGMFACIDYVNSGGGNVYKSLDGINWTATKNFTQGLENIIFANGRFTVVGTNGLVAFSDDLENFTIANTGSSNSFISITYGKDRYIAVSSSGQIISSVDGVNWNDVSISGDTTHYRVAAYGKGTFVIGGRVTIDGVNTSVIRYSTDGIVWQTATNNSTKTTSYVRSLTYYNGKFFAALQQGEIWTSVDGMSWQVNLSTSAMWAIGCGEDMVLIGGDSGLINKYDLGIEWLDYEPEINKDQVLWQKQFITLSNGAMIESEPEVHTNLTNIYDELNALDSKISLLPKFDIQVVNELPTTNISTTTIYLLSTGNDYPYAYQEYIYNQDEWELIGTQYFDLSIYATKEELSEALLKKLDANGFATSISDENIGKITASGKEILSIDPSGTMNFGEGTIDLSLLGNQDRPSYNGTDLVLEDDLQEYATKTYAESQKTGAISDITEKLESGELIPSKANIASKAVYDNLGNNIIDTYAKQADLQDLEQSITDIVAGAQPVGVATKAEQDEDGNVITDTYAVKEHNHDDKYLSINGGTIKGNLRVEQKDNTELGSIYGNVYGTVYGTASNANIATKATQDGSGNNIVSTYATKNELEDKVDKVDGYELIATTDKTRLDHSFSSVSLSDNILTFEDHTGEITTITLPSSGIIDLGTVNGITTALNSITTNYKTQSGSYKAIDSGQYGHEVLLLIHYFYNDSSNNSFKEYANAIVESIGNQSLTSHHSWDSASNTWTGYSYSNVVASQAAAAFKTATVNENILTFTKNDNTTESVTLPSGMSDEDKATLDKLNTDVYGGINQEYNPSDIHSGTSLIGKTILFNDNAEDVLPFVTDTYTALISPASTNIGIYTFHNSEDNGNYIYAMQVYGTPAYPVATLMQNGEWLSKTYTWTNNTIIGTVIDNFTNYFKIVDYTDTIIPTKTSQLINDSDYITNNEVGSMYLSSTQPTIYGNDGSRTLTPCNDSSATLLLPDSNNKVLLTGIGTTEGVSYGDDEGILSTTLATKTYVDNSHKYTKLLEVNLNDGVAIDLLEYTQYNDFKLIIKSIDVGSSEADTDAGFEIEIDDLSVTKAYTINLYDYICFDIATLPGLGWLVNLGNKLVSPQNLGDYASMPHDVLSADGSIYLTKNESSLVYTVYFYGR